MEFLLFILGRTECVGEMAERAFASSSRAREHLEGAVLQQGYVLKILFSNAFKT